MQCAQAKSDLAALKVLLGVVDGPCLHASIHHAWTHKHTDMSAGLGAIMCDHHGMRTAPGLD